MDPASPPPAARFAEALVAALADGGLAQVCIAPGSRSAPLAAAFFRHEGIRCWSHVDERSAGFFALGLARARREPVALVCTSGTAAANFLPAVVEADLSRVPLLALTADRPPEVRDWAAPQTIHQPHLYGRHVRWFAEPPVPDGSRAGLRHARALAARALALARGRRPGPVHLNLPFREPLEPGPLGSCAEPAPAVREWPAADAPSPRQIELLTQLVQQRERGVIACGPCDDPDLGEALVALARAAGWPILADPTSQLRCGPHVASPVLAHGDLLLGDPGFRARRRPEVVLRVGGVPVSKGFGLWLEETQPERVLVIDPEEDFGDPWHRTTDRVRAARAPLCEAVARRVRDSGRLQSPWCSAFLEADARAAALVARRIDGAPELLEPMVVRALADALTEGARLYVSNSMPVRDLDAFLPASTRSLRVLCNRGANGIDGILSSALGAAAAGGAPTALLTGDLAFLHDLGGLLAARRHPIALTIVVLNNEGGGIFSFLPIAEHGASVGFEELFRTPHGVDLSSACRAFGVNHVAVGSREHLATQLKESLAAPRTTVLEVSVDRDDNTALQRSLRAELTSALQEPAG